MSEERMAVVKLLRKARKLIVKGWCKGTLARDAAGNDVDANSRKAVRWCAAGACFAANRGAARLANDAWMELDKDSGGAAFLYNDASRDRRRVLRLYDTTIARLLEEAKS